MTPDSKTVFDTTIVGAGPTGLFAAFCAGMREMTVKVIERLPEPGGQLAVLYPDKYVYDSPGYSRVLARDLVKELIAQSKTFAVPAYCFDERAMAIKRKDGHFVLTTDTREHQSRTLIIAAGIGAFSPKKMNAPGTEEGKPGIHYYVKEMNHFSGRRVLIVGGGDSAVDWALGLREIAASVTLIHRRDQFRAHEASVRELMTSTVQVQTFHELKEVHGDDRIEGATIRDSRTGRELNLPIDDVIFALGFEADLGEIRAWGLQLDDQRRHLSVNPSMETNIPGVYAAGDVTELAYLEKMELPEEQRVHGGSGLSLPSPKFAERKERWGLIVMGYAQATAAVNHAKQFISPTAKLFPGHSSEMTSTRLLRVDPSRDDSDSNQRR